MGAGAPVSTVYELAAYLRPSLGPLGAYSYYQYMVFWFAGNKLFDAGGAGGGGPMLSQGRALPVQHTALAGRHRRQPFLRP